MADAAIDLELAIRHAEATKAGFADARRRRMVDVYIQHVRAEVAGELAPVMATMIDEPVFHIWTGGVDVGPKGRAAVEGMYRQMFDSVGNYFEMALVRFVVDETCIVKEFVQRKIVPGRSVIGGPLAAALRAGGVEPDADAHYLSEGRVVAILPFDEAARMIGEDAYSAGGPRIRRLAPEDLPAAYLARLASA